MKEKNPFYYLIQDGIIAKREMNGKLSKDYLLRDGKWIVDSDCVIMDRMAGSDPQEPGDSPCRSGSTGILPEMDEIPEEQAILIMNQQILDVLKSKWKAEFETKKEEWDKNPGWPAKYVKTEFILNGGKYSLFPSDIGLTYDCWDQGFMETVQADISEDLEEYGATDIRNIGFID